MLQHVPVFPLSVMPHPSCRMPLRIFEPRYVNMVSEVMQSGSGFAITIMSQDYDGDSPYMDHETGIYKKAVWVEIDDFTQGEDGLLHINVVGRDWVSLSDLEKDDSGLWRAMATKLPRPAVVPSDDKTDSLYRVVEDAAHASDVHMPDIAIATTEQKVGYLSLMLPIGPVQRIELADARNDDERMNMLAQWVSISEA